LTTKVEKSELVSIADMKSNKKDTYSNMKAIDILHKQIKHLSVILVEILRKEAMEFSKAPDLEQTIKKNMFSVLQQGLHVAKWINKFNPENINTDDLILPRDLYDFQELVNEALGEIEQKMVPKTLKAPKLSVIIIFYS
jgi:hypothetical protein